MRFMHLLTLFLILGLVSCATKENEIFVSTYHLKDIKEVDMDNKLLRAEQQKYLRGAVEESEQLERMGFYYTAEWRLEDGSQALPEKVVFYYRQAATGDKVFKMEKALDPSKRKGVCEFSVIGEAYQTGGRVLAWRAELYVDDGRGVAYEQSYLWE